MVFPGYCVCCHFSRWYWRERCRLGWMCPLAKLNFDLNGLLCSKCGVSAGARLVALRNRAVRHMAVAARSCTLKINTGVELGMQPPAGAYDYSLQYRSWSLDFFNLHFCWCTECTALMGSSVFCLLVESITMYPLFHSSCLFCSRHHPASAFGPLNFSAVDSMVIF